MDIQELKTLAEGGDAESQNNLGLRYDQGKGVEQNHAKAAEWYQKAAEQGYEKAKAENVSYLVGT